MKILTFIKNDSPSISQQINKQPSVIKKIKRLIDNLLSFIQNHTPSKSTISKKVTPPLNLSHEILRVLDEEKSAQGNKKDFDLITFFFHETIYDIMKNTSTNMSTYDIPRIKPMYDTPKQQAYLTEEPIYEEIDDSRYRVDNRKIIYEEIYAPTYDIPRIKPMYDTPKQQAYLTEEPIYEEIDDSRYRVDNRKIVNDIPPPLPPRNW